MKNRFCRMGKALLGAACLLSTCGVTYSCSDDFELDETRPSFLGKGIYDELKSRGDFNTVVRLIDDLDKREDLSRTGSRTLFVADDDAYKKFFETNTIFKDGNGNPVRNYDQLSLSQKKLLLNGSMLSSAYVLEMLTTLNGPIKNQCLRRLTYASVMDSVPYFKWNELPENLNRGEVGDDGEVVNADKRFWDRYRNQAKGGIYLALDKTVPMMTHFLEGQLRERKISNADIAFVLNDTTLKEGDMPQYVYDAKIVEGDQVCLNGYYHVLDRVVVTPQNMAEVIRTNGETNLFSCMLDRFSAPYYDKTLEQEFNVANGLQLDSMVFQKRYISQRSQDGAITLDPDGMTLGNFPFLGYDPGWNTYNTSSSVAKEMDMAAMFVPSDDAMKEYFLRGGGAMLIKRYCPGQPNDEAHLKENLYQIPLPVIRSMIANLMKDSFNETVPSKYRLITNDAQDGMFADASVDAYKKRFKKVMMANNGVIYVMNGVVAPAEYSSVMAPVQNDGGAEVMNTTIHADDNFTETDNGSAPLRKYYKTYLLAMQSNFSLFAPTDEAFANHGYFDAATTYYGSGVAQKKNWRFWTFVPKEITGTNHRSRIALTAQAYAYDEKKDMAPSKSAMKSTEKSDANNDVNTEYGRRKANLLTEMMDQHILIHEVERDLEKSERQYFLSRSGAPVFVKQKATSLANNGKGMVVEGGLQLLLKEDKYPENDFSCTVVRGNDMTRENEGNGNYGNGMTYFIDRPIQATYLNVHQKMELLPHNTGSSTSMPAEQSYYKFFELAMSLNEVDDIVNKLFIKDDMTDSEKIQERNKYKIFTNERKTANGKMLVRFFNNYRYTIFIPNDAAVDKAYEKGLPTLQEIREFIGANVDKEGLSEEQKKEGMAKAKAMLTTLVNFVKYHFADESFFVDKVTASTRTQSACIDDQDNFIRVEVEQTPGKMQVYRVSNLTDDKSGQPVEVDAAMSNILARDYVINQSQKVITSSSYVVMHGLKDYLIFDEKLENGFNAAWKDAATAKAFVKKYSLKN